MEPEARYAEIEKEMLAVVFVLQKFDQYIYGRPVTIQWPQATSSHFKQTSAKCT